MHMRKLIFHETLWEIYPESPAQYSSVKKYTCFDWNAGGSWTKAHTAEQYTLWVCRDSLANPYVLYSFPRGNLDIKSDQPIMFKYKSNWQELSTKGQPIVFQQESKGLGITSCKMIHCQRVIWILIALYENEWIDHEAPWYDWWLKTGGMVFFLMLSLIGFDEKTNKHNNGPNCYEKIF